MSIIKHFKTDRLGCEINEADEGSRPPIDGNHRRDIENLIGSKIREAFVEIGHPTDNGGGRIVIISEDSRRWEITVNKALTDPSLIVIETRTPRNMGGDKMSSESGEKQLSGQYETHIGLKDRGHQ